MPCAGAAGRCYRSGACFVLGWVGAAATSFIIRGAYDRRMASPLASAELHAAKRLQDREQAQRIARTNPALAAEMGIGRPDRAGAADAGLVDVNNASVTALLVLPGVDGELATRMVEDRERVHGFSSLEDMGSLMELDGALVDGLRDRVVFLPRPGAV